MVNQQLRLSEDDESGGPFAKQETFNSLGKQSMKPSVGSVNRKYQGSRKNAKIVHFGWKSDGKTDATDNKFNHETTRKTLHRRNERHHNIDLRQRIAEQREKLPIYGVHEDLVHQLKSHSTAVLLADTGSGKSTQVPQFLLEDDASEYIAVTQPRRVAAISLATRVAQEVGCHVGGTVGYSVRFDTRANREKTHIKYVTDGMLLRELMIDGDLKRYTTVILDEAHERTVVTDLLMGLLKSLQAKRARSEDLKPLRIIVMSATIDAEKFSEFFDKAPILYVPGKTYPVQRYYLKSAEDDILDACVNAICYVNRSEPTGDMLVFLAGQEEIDRAVDRINQIQELLEEAYQAMKGDKHDKQPRPPKMLPVPLYASLPPHKQKKAFEAAPRNARKIIIATNIAETSVTIPGVRYVIDSGLRKVKVWRSALSIDSLLACPISQASASQRSGRAGREAPGKCFRLYTEKAYMDLRPQTEPEILRCDLASTVLALKCVGVQDVVKGFHWLDSPGKKSLASALLKLYGLGALDDNGTVTKLGRRMSVLPLTPHLAAVLLAAQDSEDDEILPVVLDIVACLSVQDVLLTPAPETRDDVNAARKSECVLGGVYGDLIMLKELWDGYRQVEGSGEKKKWCKKLAINYRAMKNVGLVRQQLDMYLRSKDNDTGSTISGSSGKKLQEQQCETIVQCFLKGFASNTATGLPDRRYRALINQSDLAIHPSSMIFGKKEEAIMFIEHVYTTKAYGRMVSPIKLEWLAFAAPQLLGRMGGGIR